MTSLKPVLPYSKRMLLQVWTEFKVIQETSALTFMVAGTFKEIVTGRWHSDTHITTIAC